MSYLNVPRIHFHGRFQADPSTVNNNDANYDPSAVLEEGNPNTVYNSVYWNPNGTHNFKFSDCTVGSVANDQGALTQPSDDPVIGAKVLTVFDKVYTAKIVDLDPDNQMVSQIFGLKIRVRIPDPADPTKTLATVTGTMPPTAFADLWARAVTADPADNAGMPTLSATYQSILQDVNWDRAAASPLLTALQALSPDTLSVRFIVDSYQPDMNQPNFTFGRVVGAIGPAFAGEPTRFVSRRLAPASGAYGPAGVTWDAKRSRLILDLGNSIPTLGSQASGRDPVVPADGWPMQVPARLLELSFPAGSQNTAPRVLARLKSGAGLPKATPLPQITFTLDTYVTHSGIVEIPIEPAQVKSLLSQPLTLTDVTATPVTVALQEDSQGRYADVSLPFFRIDPLDPADPTTYPGVAQVTLYATKFGQPWPGAALDLTILPQTSIWPPTTPAVPPPGTIPLWMNGTQPGLSLQQPGSSTITVTTGDDGTVAVTLLAVDPGVPRKYADGNAGPDGQVYFVSGSWANWGQIFQASGAPINVLVFSGYAIPEEPNWEEHISPIFSYFAKVYPYMKTILDLSDYDVATDPGNIPAIKHVLNLSVADPHHMPVVRDLSAKKLATINRWYEQTPPLKNRAPVPPPQLA